VSERMRTIRRTLVGVSGAAVLMAALTRPSRFGLGRPKSVRIALGRGPRVKGETDRLHGHDCPLTPGPRPRAEAVFAG
jgi:hypothetical protein